MSFIAAAMYEAMERGEMERVKMLVVMQAVFTSKHATTGGGSGLLICDRVGRPTIQPDRAPSNSKPPVCPRPAGRSSVGSGEPCLPQRPGGYLREKREVCPTSGQRKRNCSGDETSKKTGKPKKKGGKKGSSEASLPADCDEARELLGEDSCSAKAPLPDFISSLDFGADLIKITFNSRTRLGKFCRQFMTLRMMGGSYCPSKQLWPCPIPESLTRATELISGRHRSRFRLRAVVRGHLRVFISTCNWLVTRRNKAVSGPRQPMSPSQMRMVDDLETMVRLFYRLSPGPSSVLDRALGKSTNIQDALSSLSGATAVLRARFPQF